MVAASQVLSVGGRLFCPAHNAKPLPGGDGNNFEKLVWKPGYRLG